jgi:serine/threonine protein kinase
VSESISFCSFVLFVRFARSVCLFVRFARSFCLFVLFADSKTSLCGFPPYFATSDEQLYKITITDPLRFPMPYWENVSAHAIDFISKAMEKDPAKRLGAEQCLQHEWFTSAGEKTKLPGTLNRLGSLLSTHEPTRKKTGDFSFSRMLWFNNPNEKL